MPTLVRRLLSVTAPLLLVACSGPSSPSLDLVVEPIQVDSVDVILTEGAVPLASARVQGVIGDGCASLHSTSQSRTGNAVTITIRRERPRTAVCAQLAKLYDEVLRLNGDYPAGDYVVTVNGVEQRFTTR
jgi:hypothetical protein